MTWNNGMGTLLIIAGAVSALSATLAGAAPVLVFQDNFEDATVVPGPPNAPQYGSYPTDATTDPEASVVAAGGSYPASPGDGSNLMRIFGKQRNYGVLSSPASDGTLTIEFDARMDASSDFAFGLIGNAGTAQLDGFKNPVWVRLSADGTLGAYDVNNGGWQVIPGVSHTMSTWQHYKLEYELGATSFTLTTGSSQAIVSRLNATTSVPEITHLFLLGGTNSTTAYVDNVQASFAAVPEPAALALFGLGAPMLLPRRRR